MKEAILEDLVEIANNNVDGNFPHLATALDLQWKDLKVKVHSVRTKRAAGQGGVLAQAES